MNPTTKPTTRIDNFAVMAEMCRRSLKLQLFPMQNFHSARLVDGGRYGQVTFNVTAEQVVEMSHGEAEYAGGLIFADKAQFDALKAEMEAAIPKTPAELAAATRAALGDEVIEEIWKEWASGKKS